MESAAPAPPDSLRAELHLYQLYDVGYSIELEAAQSTLTTPTTRVRPVVSRGGSIDIAQLPLEMRLNDAQLTIGDRMRVCRLHAHIYDLGILAFRLTIPLSDSLSWRRLIGVMADVQNYPAEVMALLDSHAAALTTALQPTITRPNATMRTEDYTLLVVGQLAEGAHAAELANHPALLQAALGERRPLSQSAQQLATAFSYYEDDLILLTWSAAIVIDPDAAARDDAALLLEFANTQLLAFRSYDDEVERELARITPRLARPRRATLALLSSSARFLSEITTLIVDINEASARVENALKVSEDVYWNRVYSGALTILRIEVWRAGIAQSLDVLRQQASLLRDEAQTALATGLEILVIVLIAVEVVIAVLSLRVGIH